MQDTYINFLCWTSFPPNFLNLATLVYPERQTFVQMVPPGHLPGTSKESAAPADDSHYNDAGPDRPVILHRLKYTNDVTFHAHASTNSVRQNASRRASPGVPAVVSGRAPEGGEFVA